MKNVTMTTVRKLETQLSISIISLIKKTMKDNDMGLKDAYQKCKDEYYRKYRCPMPKAEV